MKDSLSKNNALSVDELTQREKSIMAIKEREKSMMEHLMDAMNNLVGEIFGLNDIKESQKMTGFQGMIANIMGGNESSGMDLSSLEKPLKAIVGNTSKEDLFL